MAVHYHGLPLTPIWVLDNLAGKHVCLSFATAPATQVEWALRRAQSIMWDNGAFSAYTKKMPFDAAGFYQWIAPNLTHPHWGVIPDAIDGSIADQRALRATWPFHASLGAPVWHLGLPTDYLLELTDGHAKVCFGSSGLYWKIGSPEWEARMDEAFECLAKRRNVQPWIHGLRMLSQLGKRWPLASADSVNVARNYKTASACPGCMSHRIDIVNAPAENFLNRSFMVPA